MEICLPDVLCHMCHAPELKCNIVTEGLALEVVNFRPVLVQDIPIT